MVRVESQLLIVRQVHTAVEADQRLFAIDYRNVRMEHEHVWMRRLRQDRSPDQPKQEQTCGDP
jgi:hypothetical protein